MAALHKQNDNPFSLQCMMNTPPKIFQKSDMKSKFKKGHMHCRCIMHNYHLDHPHMLAFLIQTPTSKCTHMRV